jgi:hypothetical protein
MRSARKPGGKLGVGDKVESIEEVDEMIECGTCKSWTTMGKMNKEKATRDFMCGFCAKGTMSNMGKRVIKLEESVNMIVEEFNVMKEVEEASRKKMDEMDELMREKMEEIERLRKEVGEKVLVVENEQSEKKEQRSWVDVVRSKNRLQKEFKETQGQIQRERNIIIKGVGEEDHILKVTHILLAVGVNEEMVESMAKIGEKKDGKKRPWRVTLKEKKVVFETLRKKKMLNEEAEFMDIFIERDLTRMEQKMEYELRQEVKKRRNQNEFCYIRNGEVVSRGAFLGKKEREEMVKENKFLSSILNKGEANTGVKKGEGTGEEGGKE